MRSTTVIVGCTGSVVTAATQASLVNILQRFIRLQPPLTTRWVVQRMMCGERLIVRLPAVGARDGRCASEMDDVI
eukprot:scaffold88965_cov47-Attheya_sp.AAC.2